MAATTGLLERGFVVPADRVASAPPERRGLPRDQVNLLIARPHGVLHTRFAELGRALDAGDLLVVNTSPTRAAAIDGWGPCGRLVVHLSTEHGPGDWTVELRRPDGTGPVRDAEAGTRLRVDGGGRVTLRRPVAAADHPRLWRARVDVPGADVGVHLHRHGRPITYGKGASTWPLADYQTIFAATRPGGGGPGSAEMASAARPFSARMLAGLVRHGIRMAPLTLHAGVSSPEAHEPPADEWFDVPPATAALVDHTRRSGGRVVAVGTTVVRALESAAGADGRVRGASGWTDLVLGPDRPARVVGGLVTGWHEAQASHLLLLEAVAGAALVDAAYHAALPGPYLWHEFGDSCLLLPG